MKTNLSRFKKISQLLLNVKSENDFAEKRSTNRVASLKLLLNKNAAYSAVIKSWDDLEKEFGDQSLKVKEKWESHIKSHALEPLRTNDVKSFIDFYNKKGLEILPEEAKLAEEKLLPEIKSILNKSRASKMKDKPADSVGYKNKAPGVFGDKSPKWLDNGGFENGPQQHQKRHGGDPKYDSWTSNNAWDLLGPAGTVVHSLTKGKVGAVRPAPSGAYNIFGTHVSINGLDGYPNVFYTHVENVLVKPGDIVEVGTPIAQITTPPPPPPDKDGKEQKSTMPHHVHVGVEGVHISTLINSSGKFKEKDLPSKSPGTFV